MSRKRIFVASALSPILPEDWKGNEAERDLALQQAFAMNIKRAEAFCRWVVDDKCMRPFAPHLFYTRFLDEFSEAERNLGIQMGIEDLEECQELWAFLPKDGRPTRGMTLEIARATRLGMTIRIYTYEEWSAWMPKELLDLPVAA
jgi:hypothetical protein